VAQEIADQFYVAGAVEHVRAVINKAFTRRFFKGENRSAGTSRPARRSIPGCSSNPQNLEAQVRKALVVIGLQRLIAA
jgi:hypothetical protein